MKKNLTLLLILTLVIAFSSTAQGAKEAAFVHDSSQGYLFNKFKDNWFLTIEGGGGVYFSQFDSNRKLLDRVAPGGAIYVGKWFSPVLGLRLGASWLEIKGLSDGQFNGNVPATSTVNGFYKQKFNEIGPVFDAMLNLTNWWCGYRPARVYNAMLYAGVGGYFSFIRDAADTKWFNQHDNIVAGRIGLINSFNVSRQVALSLDVRYDYMSAHRDASQITRKMAGDVQAYLAITYLFDKRQWSTPLIPVCPEPEDCDAIKARLEAAEGRISDLEAQLKDALAHPAEVIVEKAEPGPLATIYYPINVYSLTSRDLNVLQAIANVMKANPDKHYVLTGWADNYTGSEQFNVRLRHNRVNGVAKQLFRFGVPQSQISVTVNNGNLCDMGVKYVALDRAVTISEGQ